MDSKKLEVITARLREMRLPVMANQIVTMYEASELKDVINVLAKLDADRSLFAETVKKSSEMFKKDYDLHSRVSLYYKYIGQEYVEMLKTVNSDEYLENVPNAVYQYIRDCFKEEPL